MSIAPYAIATPQRYIATWRLSRAKISGASACPKKPGWDGRHGGLPSWGFPGPRSSERTKVDPYAGPRPARESQVVCRSDRGAGVGAGGLHGDGRVYRGSRSLNPSRARGGAPFGKLYPIVAAVQTASTCDQVGGVPTSWTDGAGQWATSPHDHIIGFAAETTFSGPRRPGRQCRRAPRYQSASHVTFNGRIPVAQNSWAASTAIREGTAISARKSSNCPQHRNLTIPRCSMSPRL